MTAPTAQAYYEMLWSPENTENVTSLKVTGTESLGASSLKQLEDSLGNQDFNETDYAAVMMLDLTMKNDKAKETAIEILAAAGVYDAGSLPMKLKDSRYFKDIDPSDPAWSEAYKKAPTIEVDYGSYGVYNKLCYAAPKGELSNWKDVLDKSIGSWKESEAYQKKVYDEIKAAGDAIAEQMYNSSSASSVTDTADLMYDSWKKREESSDCRNEKYRDSILGYDRVYDTETGSTYRVSTGFMDNYSGTRYTAATDSQYLQPVQGTFRFSVDQNGEFVFDTNG